MDLKQRFKVLAHGAIFLEKDNIGKYLKEKGWLEAEEDLLKLEKPGEGNMNFVFRAKMEEQSIIIKQARPWVEKYPQIDAPMERIRVEAAFYNLIQQDQLLASFTPRCLDWDPKNNIMILEDLGMGADLLPIYQKNQAISREDLKDLIQFLSQLHLSTYDASEQEHFPKNQALKMLNHEHIFRFPYLEENGFDLDPVQTGLQSLAMTYKTDAGLKHKIQKLGQRYLGVGPCLIHGDYYPGSWLKVAGGVKVIDPEFGYFGWPEFDLGVMIAHLKMAQTSDQVIQWVLSTYQAPSSWDESFRQAFTGVEIMRRIIGIAQLPLALSLEEKSALMEEAKGMLG